MMRQTVTALFKYERIELLYCRADEARGYAERVNIGYLVFVLRVLVPLKNLRRIKY